MVDIVLPPQPTVTVKLLRPIPWIDNQTITEIKLREPKGGQYVKLGDPRILVFNASGSGYWVEQHDIINAYLDACIVYDPPGGNLGASLVDRLAIEDVMGVKEALFGFFSDAGAKRSAIKLTVSSSGSA